jgi:hypothetical protein
MQDSHTLTRHKDIQNWVADRRGLPAIRRVPNRFGEMHQSLMIHFDRAPAPEQTPTIDDGVSPVSWTAWLAELDRQQLALKVSEAEYEFVKRQDLH